MDIFDQYLLEELIEEYKKENHTVDEYEELYQRFCNLDYLEEVKPYIYAMRYMGWGTKPEPQNVITEMEKQLSSADYCLKGLYYDLKLISEEDVVKNKSELMLMVDKGYTNEYLKAESRIKLISERYDKNEVKKDEAKDTVSNENIKYKSMSFEGCGYSGLRFTSGDIDYLHAKVFIEPIKKTRHLKVRSQIYDGDEPFSKVFSDEYTLNPGTTWFRTTGWGNKNFNCYGNRVYKWIIELDGKDAYSQTFRFYDGKIDKEATYIKDLELFASKASGALDADKNNYKTSFDSTSLEYVYFKLFMDNPGEAKNIQIFLKVRCLDDNTVFCDKYIIHRLNADTIACWNGIGFANKGMWKKGLYEYSLRVGKYFTREGMFSVY